jgi:hypothetical protein
MAAKILFWVGEVVMAVLVFAIPMLFLFIDWN